MTTREREERAADLVVAAILGSLAGAAVGFVLWPALIGVPVILAIAGACAGLLVRLVRG